MSLIRENQTHGINVFGLLRAVVLYLGLLENHLHAIVCWVLWTLSWVSVCFANPRSSPKLVILGDILNPVFKGGTIEFLNHVGL